MAEYLYNQWAPRSSQALVLGDVGAGPQGSALSVKPYVVSGVTVWGSYQSPDTDKVLRNMKAQINRFGAGLDANGLVGPKTVDAISKIATAYPGAPTAPILRGIAAGGVESVARQGRALWGALATAANYAGRPTSGASGSSGESGPSRPITTSSSSGGGGGPVSPITPYDTQAPGIGAGIAGMFGNLSPTAKMVAGGGFVLAVFLATRAAKKAGKKRR